MVGKLRSPYPSRLRLAVCGALVLVALAGCGRNYFFAEREPWRREAEVACLKSGAVRESQVLIRQEPITGPGMCGADFPLKVAALGEVTLMGYADDLRPPGAIPGSSQTSSPQPRWPIAEPRAAPATYRNGKAVPTVDPAYRMQSPAGVERAQDLPAPMQIAPANTQQRDSAPARYEPAPAMRSASPSPSGRRSVFDAPRSRNDDDDEFAYRPDPASRPASVPSRPAQRPAVVPLGPHTPYTGSVAPVEIKPTATLACPIVSALDRWIVDAIQPAARRWFGQPVAEIRQISAYSCRGMNGQAGARISEHAFGNALDIASFVLADGRKITVKDGWRGTPEEQGFLRDVQGAACEQFTTVLAPGSNRFHYDHIHVDLMRRPSGRSICNPDAVAGEDIAARVAKERGYALRRDPSITGSIGGVKTAVNAQKDVAKKKSRPKKFFSPDEDDDDWVEDDGPRERDD